LRIVGALVDENHASTVAAMDRIWPTIDQCDSKPIKTRTVIRTFADLPAIKSLAGAVRWEHSQVAGTPVGAVTSFNIISFPPPIAHSSISF
jgi:hypothetical protein